MTLLTFQVRTCAPARRGVPQHGSGGTPQHGGGWLRRAAAVARRAAVQAGRMGAARAAGRGARAPRAACAAPRRLRALFVPSRARSVLLAHFFTLNT